MNRNLKSILKNPAFRFLAFASLLAAIEVALYHRFIFEPNYLIYWGVGGDSLAQSVPYFLSAADKFSAGDFSTWNFSQFLGAQFPQTFSPEYLASAFGPQAVPYMMLIMQMAKSYLAGVFFYFYAFYLTNRYAIRFAGGVGMALCGRMLALAPWTGYTMEVTLAIAMMWGFERFLADSRKFAVLPFAFASMIASMNVYCLILYSFFMLVYVTARIGYGGHRINGFRQTAIFCCQLFGLYLLGIMLSAIMLLPFLESYAGSARVSSTSLDVSSFATISSPAILSSQYLSTLSPYVFGSAFDYSGLTNGLNQVYYYCGAFMLLAIPFAFSGKNARQRLWLGFTVAIMLLYVFSDGFRYALNGFNLGSDDFRASSFWITLLMGYLGVLGLDAMFFKVPARHVILCLIFELALFAGCFLILRDHVTLKACVIAIAALAAYAVLFALPRIKGVPLTAAFILVACLELFAQGYPMVNFVLTNNQQDYDALFESGFEEELDNVDGYDDGRYRVAYPTQLFTRGLANNFKGTQAYIGGTGISQELTDFLRGVYPNDYVARLGYSRYAYGFNDPALSSLLSVKYLANDSNKQVFVPPYGFSKTTGADNPSRIYENENWLPAFISYSYDEAVSESETLALPREERGASLLASCAVQDTRQSRGTAASLYANPEKQLGASQNDIIFTEDAGHRLLGADGASFQIEESNSKYILVSMELHGPAQEAGYLDIRVAVSNAEGEREAVSYLTAGGNESIRIPIPNKNWRYVTVDIPYSNMCLGARISTISVCEIPESYFDAFLESIADKRAENPTISEMTNSLVKGSLTQADDGYIVSSIPWNENWQAYIDGEPVEKIKVNFGFIGIESQAGHHEVELRYVDRGQILGAALSTLALLVLLVLLLLSRRGHKRVSAQGLRVKTVYY